MEDILHLMKGELPMKTKEELNALKEEVESLNKKLAELTEEELTQVSGGIDLVYRGEKVPEANVRDGEPYLPPVFDEPHPF